MGMCSCSDAYAIITYEITCIDESKGLLNIISDSTVNYENMVRNKTNKFSVGK